MVEKVQKCVPELERVEGLAGPLGKVVRDEFVKGFTADESVKIVQEVEALFISDGAVDVLGVDILVADDELGVLVVFAEELDRVLCRGLVLSPSADTGKL